MAIIYKMRQPGNGFIPYVLVGIGLVLICVIIGLIMYFAYKDDLPSLAQLHNIEPSLITRVYDKDGTLLKEYYNQRRVLVPYNKIPPYMVDCLLAVEDRRFYDHWGVDTRRIIGAFLHNILSFDLKAQGASTLTQQLARNLFLTSKQLFSRKIKEALTAIKIENTYSKNQILEMYLNQHYLGKGAYGIQAAAQIYFSKNAWELTLPESALVIGLLKSPNPYNPINHPERAQRRRNVVYDALVEFGKLTPAMAEELKQQPLEINPTREKVGEAPYFTELVRKYISEKYGETALYNSGLSITTTLDLDLQHYAEAAVDTKLVQLQTQMEEGILPSDERYEQYTIEAPDSLNPDSTIRIYKQIQGALICIDNATGSIKALVGGKDYSKSKFNCATQAHRQPGSSFKPVVYTTAIDNGFNPSDLFVDSPIVLKAGGEEWRPSNFDGSFRGEMTLRDGLRTSRNLIAIKLMMNPLVTPQQVVSYARRMGIKSQLQPYPSLAIGGAGDVTVWEMAAAFSIFPNGGIRKEPFFIKEIRDRNGNLIEFREKADQEEVLSRQTAYIATNMLETVVNSGTGHGARRMGFKHPAGGKTGTTNDYTDNWFIGFTTQLTTAVWVGYSIDNSTTIGVDRGEVGASTALPIWAEFMKAACLDLPKKKFPVPAGIHVATICLDSGKLATDKCSNVVTDIFTDATLPKTRCPLKHLADGSAREKEGRFKIEENKHNKRF
ncbi:MAG: PBP1A family penicillin-binding protein [candidate division Zixibacteria bacterium]|nr:PBP1A family penicillin-binding protein [candidate division Zixibacteria bacterium]